MISSICYILGGYILDATLFIFLNYRLITLLFSRGMYNQ